MTLSFFRLFVRVALVLTCCAGTASAATVSGTVRSQVAEFPATPDRPAYSETTHWIETPGGGVKDLEPASEEVSETLEALSGSKARVRTAADGTAVSASPITDVRATAAPSSISLLAVIITPAGQTQDVTAAQLTGRLFTDSGSVAAYFNAQAPSGLSLTGTVVGPYDVGAQVGCSADQMAAYAESALTANGVKKSDYTHLMVYFPDQNQACEWAGLAYVNGGYSWINSGATPKVLAHELGHNIGLHHSNSVSCTGSATFVTASSCTASEYGDQFSTMGRGTGTPGPTFNAQEREILGWMPEPGFAGQTTTVMLDAVPSATNGQPRRVVFPISPTATASVEYRSTLGFDSALSPYAGSGVLVYIQESTGSFAVASEGTKPSYILDAHPATTTIQDAALTPGVAVPLGDRGASITLNGSPSVLGASVSITPMADNQAPTTPTGVVAQATGPSSAQITWTDSSDNIKVAQYRVFDNGQLIATSATAYASVTGLAKGTHAITVTARDLNRNESPATAPVSIEVGVPPRFAGSLTATRGGAQNADITLSIPAIQDSAGLKSITLARNGVEIDALGSSTAARTYTDRGQRAATTYRLDIASKSGQTLQETISVPTAIPPVPARPTQHAGAGAGLSGRLRLRCTVAGCTLTADRGAASVTGIQVKIGARTVGARNGRLSVRVPRALMGRLRVVKVTALTATGPGRTYTVRLPRPRGLGDVVSGALR